MSLRRHAMSTEHVNYNPVAPAYDQRYVVNPLNSIAAVLRSLAEGAERILEVGCGTGRWLAELRPIVRQVYGLDLSPGMLREARRQHGLLDLACGRAEQLPFPEAAFDLVFCVNALHHFDQPRAFICEARRLLRPGGALAVINMDPHAGRDRWYLYEYFPGTYETDLARFPSGGTILDWIIAAGFERVEWRVAERISNSQVGREVLEDHFLQKHGTSQLTLLTDEAYAAGLNRIKTALAEAEANGRRLVFPADICLMLLAGRTPRSDIG